MRDFSFLFRLACGGWYGLSLPVAGMMAIIYLRELRRLAGACMMPSFCSVPGAARRLLALRAKLIAEIEAAQREVRASPSFR